jgi:hypothetical protein
MGVVHINLAAPLSSFGNILCIWYVALLSLDPIVEYHHFLYNLPPNCQNMQCFDTCFELDHAFVFTPQISPWEKNCPSNLQKEY